MTKALLRNTALTTLAGLLAAAPAYAQSDAAPEQDAGGLGEILVTAQKQSENLQSVPISVSAVTSEAVDNLKATDLKGLQGAVPNIQINNYTNTPHSAVFTIRGIGVVEPDPFAGNTVSIVQDGIPQFFSMGALLDLFDVERIEVLRGPQGTLFGANTTGGVVNVMTRQPTGELGIRGEFTYGNYDRIDAKVAADFPIVDGLLSGKIAAMNSRRDGYYTNIVNGKDIGSKQVSVVRAYLRLTPASNIDAVLSGEYGASRNGAPVIVNASRPGDAIYIPEGTTGPDQLLPMYGSPCVTSVPCTAPDEYYSAVDNVPNKSNMDTYRANLTVNVSDTAIGDITAITGYKKFIVHEYTDVDGVPGLYIDTSRHTRGWQLSQELRTAAQITDRIKLQLGGFYLKTHYDHFNSIRLEFATPGLRQYQPQDQDNWSGSLFAQTYIDLTDNLRFQAGIRYTHEKTEMDAGSYYYLNEAGPALLCSQAWSCGDTLQEGGFAAQGEKSWDKVGWKVGLDYKIDNTLLYGYYARGFKSGGFVGRIAAPSDLGPYGPETVDTYELGVKTDLFDRRLRLNLAGFYTNYRDMQVAQNYFIGESTVGTSIQNAAKAEIKGFELEATALPVDGLTLTGSLAYLDATYKNFDYLDGATKTIVDLSGKQLQNSPEWSASAGATYEVAVAGGKLKANALYTYTSSKYLQGLTDPDMVKIQPTHFVHANLAWGPESGEWTVELWGRNLFDERYVEAVTWNPGLFTHIAYTPPREYGLTFKFDF